MEVELTKHNLFDLHQLFVREGVARDIMWKLTIDDAKEIGMNVGQRRRYFLALEQEIKHNPELNKGMLLPFLNPSHLEY